MRRGRALVLVGARGAGKSTLGRLLAAAVGVPFVETDALVEERLGSTIAEAFASDEVELFRDVEAHVVASLDGSREQVVSTGGGVVLEPASRRALRRLGLVVWLRAAPEVLGRRIAGSGRPSLTGGDPVAEVAAVLEQRAPLYASVSDRVVDTGARTPGEVTDELQRFWLDLQDHHLR